MKKYLLVQNTTVDRLSKWQLAVVVDLEVETELCTLLDCRLLYHRLLLLDCLTSQRFQCNSKVIQ
jgi:hypothetical protein